MLHFNRRNNQYNYQIYLKKKILEEHFSLTHFFILNPTTKIEHVIWCRLSSISADSKNSFSDNSSSFLLSEVELNANTYFLSILLVVEK